MSPRDRFLLLADRLRAKAGPAGMDVRQNSVTVRVRTWVSGEVGDPQGATVGVDYTNADTALSPVPKVRRISSALIAGSGGRYEQGDLMVGPITPYYAGSPAGGYTLAQLDPPVPLPAGGVEVLYVLSGPNAGEYRLVDLRRDRSLRYEAVIRRLRDTP